MSKIVSSGSLSVRAGGKINNNSTKDLYTVSVDEKLFICDEIDKKNVVTELIGTYTDDYNILQANIIILQYLTYTQKSLLPDLIKNLEIENNKKNQKQSFLDRRITEKTICNLEKKINELKSGRKINEYKSLSNPILKEYSKLGSLIKKKSFNNNVEYSICDNEYRLLLINCFLTVAKKFIKVDVNREIIPDNNCPICKFSLENIFVDENGYQTCPNCLIDKYCNISVPISILQLHIEVKEGYKDRDNLYKAFLRYQGKQSNKISHTVYTDLDKYFTRLGNYHRDVVKLLPLDHKGRREGTTIQIMFSALLSIKKPDHYEDVNLICKNYWEWELPDLSHLETLLMKDYDETQEVYIQMDVERRSSLGVQYRLLKHLQILGHNCDISDFKIVQMRDSIEFHDFTWKYMCENCKSAKEGNSRIRFIKTI